MRFVGDRRRVRRIYFQGNGVCLVEWADRVPCSIPEERLEIRLVVTGETQRRAELTAHGEKYEQMLTQLTDWQE